MRYTVYCSQFSITYLFHSKLLGDEAHEHPCKFIKKNKLWVMKIHLEKQPEPFLSVTYEYLHVLNIDEWKTVYIELYNLYTLFEGKLCKYVEF